MAALLIRPGSDSAEEVAWPPVDGNTLAAMYELIGCRTVEVLRLGGMSNGDDGLDMWIDEEGKFADDAQINALATGLADIVGMLMPGDMIVGNALLLSHDGPDTAPLNDRQLAALRRIL